MSSADRGVMFDFVGDGHPRMYAWPVDDKDAWLALDRNHNGQVDSGAELFGNAAVLQSGQYASNGYELLDEFDGNSDGVVDARDSRFGEILVWRDVIRNGRVDAGELVLASQVGIVEFRTRYDESRRKDQWGNEFRYRAQMLFARAPFRRLSFDVFLTSLEP